MSPLWTIKYSGFSFLISKFSNLPFFLCNNYSTCVTHMSHGFKFNWFNFHNVFNGMKVQIKVHTQIWWSHICDEVVWGTNVLPCLKQTGCFCHLNFLLFLYSLFRFWKLMTPKQDYGGDCGFSWFLALAALNYSASMFDASPAIIAFKQTRSTQRLTSFQEE